MPCRPYGGRDGTVGVDWLTLFREFITLFVLIDPIGTMPVFLFAVSRVPPQLHRRIAIRATVVAGLVLLAFLVVEQLALDSIGLRLGSFQIAGGMPGNVILTDNRTQDLAEQAIKAGLLLIVLAVTLICMLAASCISRVIGTTGASVISRVMGFVLATIAVDAVLGGSMCWA